MSGAGGPPAEDAPGLMRSLGRFFGHIVAGVRTPAARAGGSAGSGATRRTVESETREDGVVLRRTTIEEVRYPPGRTPEP
ncbi:MAG: hypothetical protein U0574_05680 [Phycisphaerales bacterium]